MKRYLRAVAVILSVALCFCACSKNTKQAAGGERVKLKVEIFERGDVPAGAGSITDNALTGWVKEEFGKKYNVDLEYVSVPRAQQVAQLNVLMAAGEAPDIIFSYDLNQLYSFYTQGALTDLTPYMNDAKELTEFLGEDVLKDGLIEDKQYFVPARRIVRGQMVQLIRQDWLDKLGMQAPTNVDEFYNVLKAFKEKDPGGLGGDVIPYAMSVHEPTMYDLTRSFIDYDSLDEADRWTMPHYMMPGYKDGVRFMNKLYNEGLISKDFALDRDRSQMYSDVASGKVGFYVDDLGRTLQQGAQYDVLKNTVPGAKLSAVDTFMDKNGKYPKENCKASGILIAVPKSSEHPEVAVQYLNWMADPDVMRHLQFGQEGVNYTMNEEGFPVKIDSEESKKTHWYNLGFDTAIIVNGKFIENQEKSVEVNAFDVGENRELYIDCYNNSLKDGWSPKTLLPTDEEVTYASVLTEKVLEVFTKSIMASPEQFDEVFEAILSEYKAAGAEAVYKARREQYIKNFGE